MKLVSENSDTEIARRDAASALRWELRELAANLLRVCAGAGRPYQIGPQAVAMLDAWIELSKLGPLPPEQDLREMLHVERYPDNRDDEWEAGIHLMVRGGLRMAAGDLLGQTAQYSAGESLLFDGLAPVEARRAANRAARLASQTPAKRSATRKKA